MISKIKEAKWIKSISNETVPNFRLNYHVKKDIKKIKLSITSMGFYRVYINDQDITTNLFMPGYTSYKNRVQVQDYDLTNLFNIGDNKIDILLGNGWGGAQRFGWMHGNHPYFDPSLLFTFEFTYQDNKE